MSNDLETIRVNGVDYDIAGEKFAELTEIMPMFMGNFDLVQGQTHASTKIMDVDIKSGTNFYIVTAYDVDNVTTIAPKFYYSDNTDGAGSSVEVNQKIRYVAEKNITGIGFYSANPPSSGNVRVWVFNETSVINSPDNIKNIEKNVQLLDDDFYKLSSATVVIGTLFVPDDFILGGYYGDNGGVTLQATSWYTRKYASVKANTKYYYSILGGQIQILTYDSSFNFIERAVNTTSNGNFTTGANVAYVRCSIYTTDSSFIPQVSLNNTGNICYDKYYVLTDGIVTTPKVANKAITREKIADGVLATQKGFAPLYLNNPKVVDIGNGYLSDNGDFHASDDYKSMYIEIGDDCECYFDYGLRYYSIIVFSGLPISHSTRISSRYRYNGDEDTAPRIDSKLSLSKGNYIGLTFITSVGVNSTLYLNDSTLYMELVDNVHLGQTQKNDAINAMKATCKLRYYGSGNNDGVNIYIPQESGYANIDFKHAYITNINADNWRIDALYAVDDGLNLKYACTTGGEWECAIKLLDRPDFSGGRMHGDEITTYLLFLCDGTPYTKQELASKGDINFNTLKIIEISNLYDPNDSVTLIAEHSREYTIDKNSIRIRQRIDWKVTDSLASSYLAMFPVAKAVSDMCYLDTFYQPELTTSLYGDHAGVKKATTYSNDLGFMGIFEISKYPTGLSGGDILNIRDNNGGDYNKMYFNVCTGGTINAGDIWDAESIYRFYLGEELETESE